MARRLLSFFSVTPNVLVMSISAFLVMFGYYMFLPMFPLYIINDKHLSIGDLGLITSAFSISQIVFQPFFGTLSDRFGRKSMIGLSLLGYAIVSLLFIMSSSTAQFFLARILMGVSSSALWPTASALLMDSTTKEIRGRTFGVYNFFENLGSLIGPVTGGILVTVYGYYWVFLIAAVLALLAALLIFLFLKKTGISSENDPKDSLQVGKPRRFGSVSKETLKQFGPLILLIGTISFINAFGYGLFQPFFPVYLQNYLFISPVLIGMIYSIGNAVPSIFSIPLGWFSDKIKKRKPFIAFGLAIIATSMFLIAFCRDLPQVILVMTVNSIGVTMFYFAMPTYIGDATHDKRGAFMGIQGSITSLGTLFGPIVSGLIWGFWGPFSTFYLNALITFFASIIAFIFIHEQVSKSDKGRVPAENGK